MEENEYIIHLQKIKTADFLTGCREGDTFGKALVRYMKECGITTEALSYAVDVGEASIGRYRTDNGIPPIRCVVAIALALRLHINRAEYLMKLCGYAFNDMSIEHSLWRTFIAMCYCSNLTIEHCNRILKEKGFKELT